MKILNLAEKRQKKNEMGPVQMHLQHRARTEPAIRRFTTRIQFSLEKYILHCLVPNKKLKTTFLPKKQIFI